MEIAVAVFVLDVAATLYVTIHWWHWKGAVPLG